MPRLHAAFAIASAFSLIALPCFSQTLSDATTVSLRAALEIAVANNPLVQQAGAAVRIADEQRREAYGGVYPQVSAEASYVRSFGGRERFVKDGDPEFRDIEGAPDNVWSGSLKLNQTALDFRIFSGLVAAGELQSLRAEQLRGAAQQVVTDVRVRYLDALLALEREALTAQSNARVEHMMSESRARHREGLVSDDELLRLEVQLANLQSNRLRAENRVAAAKGALLVAMAADPLREITLEGALSELSLAPRAVNSAANAALLAHSGAAALASASELQLRQTAMAERSDLRQLRTQQRLGELQIEIQAAEYLPTIRAFASVDFGAQDEDGDGVFGRQRDGMGPTSGYSQWQVSASGGLSVQWQIFTGFNRQARYAQRQEELHQATLRLRQAERETLHQVRTLLAGMREARIRARNQQRAVTQARRSYDIATLRYRAGVGTQLDVTVSETNRRQTEFNYAEAIYDYLAAASRLELATGRVAFTAAAAAAVAR